MLVAHFQEDLGVAQRAATAIAGDAGVIGFDAFGTFGRYGNARKTGS